MPDDPTTRRRSAFDRFLARPASLLIASLAIIGVTAATVFLGALVIYLFDDTEFATYGEALWFTPDGFLAEGSISNVFFVKDGALRTPPPETPVLPGVTRALVLELARMCELPIEENPCTLKELFEADEAFLTNAIMELMPVTRVERRAIADEKPGPVTGRLRAAYHECVRAACSSD